MTSADRPSEPAKPSVLLINHHPYSFLLRDGRSRLPVDEADIHLLTRSRVHGGVTGLAGHPLPHVTVCPPLPQEQWRAVSRWILRTHPVTAVAAVHERAVLLAAELRTEFGLPGTGYETALRFRDKVLMKEAVRAAGTVEVPDFRPLGTAADLDRVDWSTGRKVIKARRELGAKDVHFAGTLEEARRITSGLDLSGDRYEIEDFVAGRIYHCDSVVRDGRVEFRSVGRYLANPAGYAPGGVLGTVLVTQGALVGRISELNATVLAALGFENGTTHLELFHTPDDRLVFCEVAARPPGALVPQVLQAQYGFDIVETHIRLDAGLGLSPGTSLPAGTENSGTHGFVSFYPGSAAARPIDSGRFDELGIVEHVHHGHAGDGRGGVRNSTDFLDSYVVKASDEETFHGLVARIQHAYQG
ncbi:acetyl-CoA carboxylase biotin carboxylase subunit family protein [Streptomyces sp. R44]|uniref:Acetyl-CoA carboxylase biotin carboxylase subunit family protein n=1 Tax=Streptomyces sp. R44 TaxID=3238633 RepID=A0AB39TBW1_9ACTN